MKYVALIATYVGLNTSLNILNKADKVDETWGLAAAQPAARSWHKQMACHSPVILALLQWALGVYGFRFPLLLTSTHMAFSFLVLSPIAIQTSCDTHVRTLEKQWKGIPYIGGFMALNIALNNISLLDISLSLNQVRETGGAETPPEIAGKAGVRNPLCIGCRVLKCVKPSRKNGRLFGYNWSASAIRLACDCCKAERALMAVLLHILLPGERKDFTLKMTIGCTAAMVFMYSHEKIKDMDRATRLARSALVQVSLASRRILLS